MGDMNNAPDHDGRLVWMDLEMTGLNPDTDTILEIATIITDKNLNILAEGPNLVIHHTPEALARMDEWCRKHHGDSGLTRRALTSSLTLAQAEEATLAFIRQHVSERQSPLCGNSIHQDRRFLARHMPAIDAWLHYRMIDVSTIKELVRRWYPRVRIPQKRGGHRALADIRESIAELRYYRRHVFIPADEGET